MVAAGVNKRVFFVKVMKEWRIKNRAGYLTVAPPMFTKRREQERQVMCIERL
jgi:hypothetical protein